MNTIGISYIISAPSGAGKSSLIKSLLEKKKINNIKKSISYTTRSIRPGETPGEHYFFISKEKFKQMIKNNLFLEYAKIFNNYYGTFKKEVYDNIYNGNDIFLIVDWQGAQQIRQKIINTCSIFILPPSIITLKKRLKKRDQDKKEIIEQRIAKAKTEIIHFTEYDYLIINSNFNNALSNLMSIIKSNRLKTEIQKTKNIKLINNLI